MLNLLLQFFCTHKHLHVKSKETIEKDKEFEHVTYHLYCMKCDKEKSIQYSRYVDGVDNFFKNN